MSYRASLYTALFKLVLQRIDAERAHRMGARAMRMLAAIPGVLWMMDRLLRPRGESLTVRALGLEFRSPLGVAAGLDKDATWFEPLAALGFGAVEIGTVTAEGQPGNEARPRVTRLPRDRALINAMGFPNEGSEAVAPRLRGRGEGAVIGANIGKTKTVALDEAVDDYRRTARRLAPHADYIVLNVSSPNTPGLREMQSVDRLRELIAGVRAELEAEAGRPAGDRAVAGTGGRTAPEAGRGPNGSPPLLVKLSADLPNEEIEAIADLAIELSLDGIIAVNTSTDTDLAAESAAELAGQDHGGGLSGRPLGERAVEVLQLLDTRTRGRLTLISVGGVESHLDVWDRILAGASLVQAYTGLVYGGPLWPRRVNRGLQGLLDRSPWDSIEEVIGQNRSTR